MSVYLDACVIVPLFVHEPTSDGIERWLTRIEGPLHVGDLTAGEVGSALSRHVRMKTISSADAAAAYADFVEWRSAVTHRSEHVTADIVRAARLVRIEEPKLLMADAIHLTTCDRLGLLLATTDERLSEAAAKRGFQTLNPLA